MERSMRVLQLMSLLVVSCLSLKIRKCCPIGEVLDGSKCVANANSTLWIPSDSFIITSSQSTVKISKDLVNKTVNSIYKSKFEVGFPDCDMSSRDVAFAWNDPEHRDEFYLLFEGGKRILLNFYRKSVYHDNETVSFKKIFTPDLYCVDSSVSDLFLAVICPCTETTCIRKCCHESSVFDEDENDCVLPENIEELSNTSYTDWRPRFVEFDRTNFTETRNEIQYFLLSGKQPPCSVERGLYAEHQYGKRNFIFMADGSVKINSSMQAPTFIPAGEHCGDWGWNKTRGSLEPMLLRCFSKMEEDDDQRATLYAPLLIFSALLLVVSAFIILLELDPDLEKRRGVKYILGHVASLAVANVVVVLSLTLHVAVATPACIISGYIMQWSFLAAFFWLNIMCIDMSWTFSGLRPPSGSQRDSARRKFIWYSLYAWGGPSALTAAALIVEYSPGVSEDSPFKPNVGVIKCWFRDTGALWVYFYGPMAILLLTNLVLFVYTSFRILILRRETGAIRQPDSARHGGGSSSNKEKQSFVLYAKLFSLMGITWVTEIISWAIKGPKYIWFFTDAINLLRAVFIFIIFCWKPRVWSAIKKRLGCVRKCEVIATRLCCGKVLQFDSQDDPKTGTTSTSGQKDTNSKTDAVEMQNA